MRNGDSNSGMGGRGGSASSSSSSSSSSSAAQQNNGGNSPVQENEDYVLFASPHLTGNSLSSKTSFSSLQSFGASQSITSGMKIGREKEEERLRVSYQSAEVE